jgi:regulator of replication initiation timing
MSFPDKDIISKTLSELLNSATLLQNSLINNLQKIYLSYEKQISKLYNKTSKIRSTLASLILNSVFPNSQEEKLIKKLQEPNYDPMMSLKDFVLYSENYININKIKELEGHVRSLQEDIDKICIEKISLIEKVYNLEQEKNLYKKNYEISGNAVGVLKNKCQKVAEIFV